MKCSKCGNELNDGELFCSKCGNKISENTVPNNMQYNEIYESKLALANNMANAFFKEKNHTLYEYNQVCNMFAQVEQIGAHISRTYIYELDFLIEANLLEDSIFFYNVEDFEKTFDNLVRLILLYTKSDEEKEKIKTKYNKEEVLNEFKNKLKVKLEKNRKKKVKYAIIAILVIILFSIFLFLQPDNKHSNFNEENSYIDSENTNEEYENKKYEDGTYGSAVVLGYYEKYSINTEGVGKITSFEESEFLEKDDYGRYAFKVTFKYNPINKAGEIMLDREATDTVISIFIFNPDNPDSLYGDVITTSLNWEDIKTWSTLSGGKWNTPVIFND